MRKLVAGLLLFAASAQAQIEPSSWFSKLPEAKKFSVVIERSGLEWRARCDLGCAWTGVTAAFSCRENCDAILDANGLVTTKTERDPTAAFSFELSADAIGIVAKRRTGTHWESLGWSCDNRDPCTVRVNEFGVFAGGPALRRYPGR